MLAATVFVPAENFFLKTRLVADKTKTAPIRLMLEVHEPNRSS